LAILPDFTEEGWPSMDLCAEMLLRELETQPLAVEILRPAFRCRCTSLPLAGFGIAARNLDRLFNRHWDYPRFLRPHLSHFDCFHIVDHSYAQLVHSLPASRAGVYCHDLDLFRCLLEPQRERRTFPFRAMARRVLRGMQQAAVVFYSTNTVGCQIKKLGLVKSTRLLHAPYGTASEFVPEPADPEPAAAITADWGDTSFLLHVGSTIPRKRIDVLLDVFAALRANRPELRLLQVGGDWTPLQQAQLVRLGISTAVRQVRGFDRWMLASLYRRAALVLLPSDAEGFGLPVIEALACGAIVVASDLPTLREAGGSAAVYAPVGDVSAWTEYVSQLLEAPERAPSLDVRRHQAAKFSWANHARIIADAYLRLAR
jgi:glycosyltransferase involved in cell wall biosynthesis